jgi:hypothetical protein
MNDLDRNVRRDLKSQRKKLKRLVLKKRPRSLAGSDREEVHEEANGRDLPS